MKADASDVYRLAVQLEAVAGELPKGTSKAMQVAAHHVKEDWQAGLESSDVPAAASTVRYELHGNAVSRSAVVASSQGSARLRGYAYAAEYGSPTVGAHGYAQVALERNVADLERGAAIAGENALRRAFGT